MTVADIPLTERNLSKTGNSLSELHQLTVLRAEHISEHHSASPDYFQECREILSGQVYHHTGQCFQ